MKRTPIFCFLIIAIVWLSCKKDSHIQTNPQGNLYPVSFSVTNFSQENSPITHDNKIKLNDIVTPSESNILKLIYKLYDPGNNLIKTVTIKKGQPGFGTIKDSLASGNYTAVFVGLVDTVAFRDEPVTTNPGSFGYSDGFFKETFYKKLSFNVGSSYLDQDITLQRLNSGLQVIIKDALITPTTRVVIDITSIDRSYSYLGDSSLNPIYGTGNRYIPIIPVPANKIGTTNFTIGPYENILSTNHTSGITITAMAAASGVVVARKYVTGIQFKRNTITVLSGNLFTNDTTTGGFTIGYQSYSPGGLNQSF